ncbi:MAG TPA: hypothetical protein VFV55_11020 [Usitatibacteraceae bacterium]|nr:hypothetical protein [Usitatibacteraceae bacterium]
MKRLRWIIERSPLGWPGAVALVLVAVAVLGQVTVVPAMQARLDALTHPVHRAGASATNRDDDPANRLDRFYRHFREAGPAPDQLAKIYRIAATNGIALRQGDYQLVAADGRLQSYHVTLPVAGPYPAIRRFLAETLDEIPTASLDQVVFERKRIGERGIEAQLRLTLYLDR